MTSKAKALQLIEEMVSNGWNEATILEKMVDALDGKVALEAIEYVKNDAEQ